MKINFFPGMTRHRLDPEDVQFMISTVDSLLPVKSGREYRIQQVPNRMLFIKYQEQTKAANRQALSESTFNRYLDSLAIHHEDAGAICPHCEALQFDTDIPEKKRIKLRHHDQFKSRQILAYLDQRKDMTSDDLMILADFTYHDYITHGFQDMILCFYERTENGMYLFFFPFFSLICFSGTIDSSYHHFVAEIGVSNDIHFVTSVYRNFLIDRLKKRSYSKVLFWSDGARKHFKQTAHLCAIKELQQMFLGKQKKFFFIQLIFLQESK